MLYACIKTYINTVVRDTGLTLSGHMINALDIQFIQFF